MLAAGHWKQLWMNPVAIIFNSFPQLVRPLLFHHGPKKAPEADSNEEKREPKEHLSNIYSSLISVNRCTSLWIFFRLISWTFLEAVEFAHLSFFLRSNLHQSSAEQLKTHLGIDFCPEPCGLNSKRGCQRVGERRDGEWERKTEGRKETSPNKRPTKTRCSADPHLQKHEARTNRKQAKITTEKILSFPHFLLLFFFNFQQSNECPLRVCPLGHNLSARFDVLIVAASEVLYGEFL